MKGEERGGIQEKKKCWSCGQGKNEVVYLTYFVKTIKISSAFSLSIVNLKYIYKQ